MAEAFCRILRVSSLENVSVRDLPRDQLMAVGRFLSNRLCLNYRDPMELSGQAQNNASQVSRLMEEITQEAIRNPQLIRVLDPIYVFANAVGKDVEGRHPAADTAVLPLCPQPRNSRAAAGTGGDGCEGGHCGRRCDGRWLNCRSFSLC